VFESNVELSQELRLQGITQIAVMGVQSDCCIRESILGAIASGFDPRCITLLKGAHSTWDDTSAGTSYSQIKKDVEEELAALGVQLEGWQKFQLLGM
jgi:nicotinamidase-related amidase